MMSPPRRRAFSRAMARPNPLPGAGGAAGIGLVEAVENVGQVGQRYAGTAIGDRYGHEAAPSVAGCFGAARLYRYRCRAVH